MTLPSIPYLPRREGIIYLVGKGLGSSQLLVFESHYPSRLDPPKSYRPAPVQV
jgi:hypothetical protein